MYKPKAIKSSQREAGRPRDIELSAEQKQELARLYLATNASSKAGSMTLAWQLFLANHPEINWETPKSKHTLPTVVRELLSKSRAHVEHHRGGERKMRSAGYTPGLLRRDEAGQMLKAGVRASFDDATINFGVLVPWPWHVPGDKLVEKYGLRLGRFQLLVCHDEATSYVPAYSYVIRYEQSYRTEDVLALMSNVTQTVGCHQAYVLEGGVWASERVTNFLKAAGIKRIDAKGRPQCKLVENFFNRLWTRLSVLNGQVGRFRGEEVENTSDYIACRNGSRDPRGLFPTLEEALAAIDKAICQLNNTQIESREYGTWTPSEVWARDMAAAPLRLLENDLAWMHAPVIETRKVVKGMLRVTADGPWGQKMRYNFTAPWLWQHEGQTLSLYFDPQAKWPISATVTQPGKTKVLGDIYCANPVGQGGLGVDHGAEARKVMRAEYRLLTGSTPKQKTSLRALGGTLSVTNIPKTQDDITIMSSKEVKPSAINVPIELPAADTRNASGASAINQQIAAFSQQDSTPMPLRKAAGAERVERKADVLSLRLRADKLKQVSPNW